MENNFPNFLLESFLILSTCYFAYQVFFRSRLMVTFRRFFILGSFFVAIAYAVINIPIYPVGFSSAFFVHETGAKQSSQISSEPIPSERTIAKNNITHDHLNDHQDSNSKIVNTSQKSSKWIQGYFIISLLFFLGLVMKLVSFWINLNRAQRIRYKDDTIYLIKSHNLFGASLFNKILINEELLNSRDFDIIYTHEKQHQKLYHSIDIILYEIYRCFFWINPVVWLFGRELRLVHEVETDIQAVHKFDLYEYIKTILKFSDYRGFQSITHPFAQGDVKYRVNALLNTTKKSGTRNVLWVLGLYIILFFVFGCSEIVDSQSTFSQSNKEDLKSIQTRFISHQSDLPEKHQKVISRVEFSASGEILTAETYLNYPYNYDQPLDFRHLFIEDPEIDNLTHMLDGLSLEIARYPIVHGNSWPKKLAAKVENTGHPLANRFSQNVNPEITVNSEGYPTQIKLSEEKDGLNVHWRFTMNETFVYDDENLLKAYGRDKSLGTNNSGFNQYSYTSNNKIKKVSNKRNSFEITYGENGGLATLRKYVAGELMNTREYHYDTRGFKTRTDVYNRYGRPEYSVLYEYEFFEDI